MFSSGQPLPALGELRVNTSQFSVHVSGRNASTVSASINDVWNAGSSTNGGNNMYWPTTALQLRVRAGGNANDTVAGTGLRKIKVVGLDQNWDQVEETIELAGASASSPTSTYFIRLNDVTPVEYGAYVNTIVAFEAHAHADVLVETSAGNLMAHIARASNRSRMGRYSIPRGYTAYVTQVSSTAYHATAVTSSGLACRANTPATTTLPSPPGAPSVIEPYHALQELRTWSFFNRDMREEIQSPLVIPECCDLWWRALPTSAGIDLSVDMDLVLVKNAI